MDQGWVHTGRLSGGAACGRRLGGPTYVVGSPVVGGLVVGPVIGSLVVGGLLVDQGWVLGLDLGLDLELDLGWEAWWWGSVVGGLVVGPVIGWMPNGMVGSPVVGGLMVSDGPCDW